MATKNEFKTAKEFKDFIKENCPDLGEIYVKEVYNLGERQYSESPLFLYSGYSVIMAHLSESGLSLKTFEKDFFIQHIRAGIFRESADSDEMYNFCFTKSKLINSFLENFKITEGDDGAIEKIELIFKEGQHLYVEHSSEDSDATCSYITA